MPTHLGKEIADFSDRKVLLSVREWASKYGLSRTTAYELMGSGQLEFVKVGARRLIPEEASRACAWAGVEGALTMKPADEVARCRAREILALASRNGGCGATVHRTASARPAADHL